MLSYVAKVDPGSVPHFLHKNDEGELVFKPEREGAHEFESYAQASHVAHEKGGYPVHVALFGGSAMVLGEGDVVEAAAISAAEDEDVSEEPSEPATAPTEPAPPAEEPPPSP